MHSNNKNATTFAAPVPKMDPYGTGSQGMKLNHLLVLLVSYENATPYQAVGMDSSAGVGYHPTQMGR